MWSENAKKKDEDDSDESEEEEEDSEEEDSEDDTAGPSASTAVSREDRKKEKKAKKEAAAARAKGQAVQVGDLPPSDSDEEESDDDMPANPNHSRASRNQTKAPAPAVVEEATEGVKNLKVSGTPSRRERESIEAAQAKERYRKLHEAGKTDEAKADLARLRLIREKREAEAARKQVGDFLRDDSTPRTDDGGYRRRKRSGKLKKLRRRRRSRPERPNAVRQLWAPARKRVRNERLLCVRITSFANESQQVCRRILRP